VFLTAGAAELKSETTFKPEGCDAAKKSKSGDELEMHYTGTIDESSVAGEKGKQFDSSVGKSPFKFTVGAGMVIKGWDQGLVGMCIGEKRTLIIPPELGYGEQGAGGVIPGGATLKFTVELLTMGDAPPQPNIFQDIDEKHGNKDGKLSAEEIGAWFQKEQGQPMPKELMKQEDKDGDGFVSWEEFSGPKGDGPGGPKEDL
jgi:FK506-binding protein 14